MEPFLESVLDCLQGLHDGFASALTGLPPEALDWVPGEGANSLAVLAVHAAGAERYWIGDVIARDPSGRVRGDEFEAAGLEAAALEERLDDALAYCRGVLEGMALADLADMRVSPRDGREFSVGWSLAHVLEHTALHLGHAQVTRQLWEQRKQP